MTDSTTDLTTIYVHGIGMWPGLFQPVVERVDGQAHIWVRPGYSGTTEPGESPQPLLSPPEFSHQVEALIGEINRTGPALVVGVSDGATLALAAALQAPPGLVGVVTHEPLIGPLEQVSHRQVASAGLRLQREPGPEAAVDFLRQRYGGRSWYLLSASARRWSAIQHRAICAEVAQFASFAPSKEELATLAVPNITTIGSRSGTERQRAAGVLVRHTRPRTTLVTIEGCGHLAPVDAPAAFAAAVSGARAAVIAGL